MDSHSINSYIFRNNDNSTIRQKILNSTFNQLNKNNKIGNWIGKFNDDYKILSVSKHENNLIYDVYNVTEKF